MALTLTRRSIAIATALAIAGPLAWVTAPAVAAPSKVELGFQFQSADVDQNGSAVALYTVKGLPKGGKVVLQRAFGTANKFKAIAAPLTYPWVLVVA
jgi:hypothetical protein